MGGPSSIADDYAAAWATCLPTLTDSFGLVVVESLACGTPVVVGPEGAPREVVDATIGVVSPSLDAGPLATALEAALDLAHRDGIVDACRSVARRFDWDDAIGPLLEDLYASTARC